MLISQLKNYKTYQNSKRVLLYEVQKLVLILFLFNCYFENCYLRAHSSNTCLEYLADSVQIQIVYSKEKMSRDMRLPTM